MSNFYSMLSDKELDIISYLRDAATEESRESSFARGSYCDNKYFLRFWEESKEQNSLINQIFENNLILTKRVSFKESDTEVRLHIRSIMLGDLYSELKDELLRVLEYYNKPIWNNQDIFWSNHLNYHLPNSVWKSVDVLGEHRDKLCQFSIRELILNFLEEEEYFQNNIYEGPTFRLQISQDKSYTLNHGAKTSKAFVKLANSIINYYNEIRPDLHNVNKWTSNIESLRVDFSTVRNQMMFNTPLCLSIHPLDYLTASENANDWRSCMNIWDGEYRRGIIEMMNSPYVIVAYTPSEHEELYMNNGSFWNSKKWREFFIVHPQYGIFGIKGYPYWNNSLEEETISWITSLLKNVEFEDTVAYQLSGHVSECEADCCLPMRFSCGPAMYNDFYGSNIYRCALRKGINIPTDDNNHIRINYSGPSECLLCGESNDFENEASLVCDECFEYHYCSVCGENIESEHDMYMHNGREYCYNCFNNLSSCDICGTVYDGDENTVPFEGATIGIGISNEDKQDYISEEGYHFGQRHTGARGFCLCEDCLDKYIENAEQVINNAPTHSTWWQWIPLIRPTQFRSYELYKEMIDELDSDLLVDAVSLYIRDKKKVQRTKSANTAGFYTSDGHLLVRADELETPAWHF